MAQPVGRIVPSQKGNGILEFEDYIYHKIKMQKDGNIYWRCARQSEFNCSVRVTTTANGQLTKMPTGEHRHPAEPQTAQVLSS